MWTILRIWWLDFWIAVVRGESCGPAKYPELRAKLEERRQKLLEDKVKKLLKL